MTTIYGMAQTIWTIKMHFNWRKGSAWNRMMEEEFGIFSASCPEEQWISEREFWTRYFPLNQSAGN